VQAAQSKADATCSHQLHCLTLSGCESTSISNRRSLATTTMCREDGCEVMRSRPCCAMRPVPTCRQQPPPYRRRRRRSRHNRRRSSSCEYPSRRRRRHRQGSAIASRCHHCSRRRHCQRRQRQQRQPPSSSPPIAAVYIAQAFDNKPSLRRRRHRRGCGRRQAQRVVTRGQQTNVMCQNHKGER
jgi:hypothetical protein